MDENKTNEIIFDGLLNSATIYSFTRKMEELPSIEELDKQISQTLELDKKIKGLTDKAFRRFRIKKMAHTFIKVAVFIVIFFTVTATVLLNVEAIRNVVFNVLMEWQEDHTDIQFTDGENTESMLWYPSYLPEGFSETSAQPYGNGYVIVYTNENEDQIIFDQYSADTGSSSVDNEYTIYQEIEISGHPAYLFKAKTENDDSILVWESNGIVLLLTSNIDSTELIKIGESIKK